MKALKIVAIIMVALLLSMLLMMGYLFMTAEVTVEVVSSSGINASQQSEDFATLQMALETDTFMGTVFQKPEEWKSPEEYVYLRFDVKLRNGCLIPIDMIELQVVPQPTDILQLADHQVHSVEAKQETTVSAMILAPKDTHPVREIIVSYYVWGVSFQTRTLSGQ